MVLNNFDFFHFSLSKVKKSYIQNRGLNKTTKDLVFVYQGV